MFTKQKIKKLIIILIFMVIFTLSLVFHNTLNKMIQNMFVDEFSIVSNKDNLLLHFIDVEQADAAAVNLPDGKVLLIDTGSKEVNTTYIDYLKENVLHSKGKNYIDYLVLSHADMDHIGGTMKLLKNFKVGTVYMPKLSSDSNGYAEILKYVDVNCNYKTLGEEFCIKSNLYSITFFESLNETNTNDSSQVLKLECFEKSFLFVGDISSKVEKLYVDKYGDKLDVDVLKVSHHGSQTATSSKFLECVTPEYAVISVGLNNDYGHPNDEVLNRLSNVGAKVLRTDIKNDILFAEGDYYDLEQLSGVYYITNLSLDYSNLILIVDVSLAVYAVIVVIRREKKKNKHLKDDLLV